jgi:hypothetical protein
VRLYPRTLCLNQKILYQYKIITCANTDGSINKLVTLFARFSFKFKFLLCLKPGYAYRSQGCFCTWSHDLASGSLHREAAPLPSAMLLHRDSILVASQLVPRFRQLAIKFVPGWQKPRHASLHSGWCLDAAMNGNTGPAFSHLATFTNTYRWTVMFKLWRPDTERATK